MSVRKIGIIGAGISGLAAGRALADRGFDVEIIEARDRVGGRLHTVDGIDHGAHWIHGTEGNPLTDLARRLSQPTMFVGGDPTYVGGWEHISLIKPGGEPVSASDKLRSILLVDHVHECIEDWRREARAKGGPDQSLAAAAQAVMEREALDMEGQGLVDWHLQLLAREDWAAGADRLSALSWDDGYEVFGYGDSILTGGFQPLAERLASGLKIHLNTPVRRIEYDRAGTKPVRIFTDCGWVEYDQVIVTLPLGVLKAGAVTFDPPLPAAKQEAIGWIGVGNLTKVIMWFERPFWPEDVYTFGLVGQTSDATPTMLISMSYSHNLPCLVALVGGRLGEEVEAMSEAETRAWATELLDKYFGSERPQLLRVEKTGWHSDPYSRGSYSYLAIGARADDFDALAAPVGNSLLFAGEATNRQHWSCAHAGLLSGLREAARITGDQSILPTRHFTESRSRRDQLLRLSRFLEMRTGELGDAAIEARCAVLRRSDVFKSVAAHELRLLASMFEERSLDAGEVLCNYGDHAKEVYVVSEGAFEIRSRKGERIGNAATAAVVGEYGMFAAMRRQATVVAVEPSRVLALDYPRFSRFLSAFPESMHALMRLTVERVVAQSSRRRSEGKVKAKFKEWLHRYLPLEILGTVTALIGAFLASLITANPVALAFAGTWGENVGYYGYAAMRDYQRKVGVVRLVGHMLFEFGLAEALDSFVVRPACMYAGQELLGSLAWGITAGKFAADIVFYLLVIMFYELRKKLLR